MRYNQTYIKRNVYYDSDFLHTRPGQVVREPPAALPTTTDSLHVVQGVPTVQSMYENDYLKWRMDIMFKQCHALCLKHLSGLIYLLLPITCSLNENMADVNSYQIRKKHKLEIWLT